MKPRLTHRPLLASLARASKSDDGLPLTFAILRSLDNFSACRMQRI